VKKSTLTCKVSQKPPNKWKCSYFLGYYCINSKNIQLKINGFNSHFQSTFFGSTAANESGGVNKDTFLNSCELIQFLIANTLHGFTEDDELFLAYFLI
jgi:hypothetical protein